VDLIECHLFLVVCLVHKPGQCVAAIPDDADPGATDKQFGHPGNVNADLEIGGIVMTMFDVRTNLSRQVVDEVKKHLPEKIFENVIPRTVRLSEAPSFGKTIFAYDPLSPGATAYKKLAKEVIERFSLKSE